MRFGFDAFIGGSFAEIFAGNCTALGLPCVTLADDDLAALCEVPGVGKKTAQRLLVELKATVVLPVLAHEGGRSAAAGPATLDSLGDVREALANLGYSAAEIRTALADVEADDGRDAGLMLKQALLNLSA